MQSTSVQTCTSIVLQCNPTKLPSSTDPTDIQYPSQISLEVKSSPTTTIEKINTKSSPIDVDALPDQKNSESCKLERDLELSCNVFFVVIMQVENI